MLKTKFGIFQPQKGCQKSLTMHFHLMDIECIGKYCFIILSTKIYQNMSKNEGIGYFDSPCIIKRYGVWKQAHESQKLISLNSVAEISSTTFSISSGSSFPEWELIINLQVITE